MKVLRTMAVVGSLVRTGRGVGSGSVVLRPLSCLLSRDGLTEAASKLGRGSDGSGEAALSRNSVRTDCRLTELLLPILDQVGALDDVEGDLASNSLRTPSSKPRSCAASNNCLRAASPVCDGGALAGNAESSGIGSGEMKVCDGSVCGDKGRLLAKMLRVAGAD